MITAYIYKIEGRTNGRCYVGSTSNYKNRWGFHRYLLRAKKHHSSRLQTAFNRHGEMNFSFEVIEICNSKNRLVRESFWIEKLGAFSSGYNCIRNPENPVFSEECLELRSQKIRAGLARPGVLEKRTEAIRASSQRPETRALHSRNSKARWADPIWRAKMLAIIRDPKIKAKKYSKGWSKESRQKASISAKRRCASAVRRQQLSMQVRDYWIRNPITPQQRAVRSANLRRRFSDPAERIRHGENTRRGILLAKSK